MKDVIQLLRELRQSSQSSVVSGIDEGGEEERPSVKHPIDDWLVELILDQVTAPPGNRKLSLIVLSGNAGDGKSYLLRAIYRRLRDEEKMDPSDVKWLLDGTESRHQNQRSVDRLDEFLAPFADAESWEPAQLHVAAMNTGAVMGFKKHDADRKRFNQLTDVLGLQLAVQISPEKDDGPDYWKRFDRVLVVDLDRRMLVPLAEDEPSFLDEMLDTLDPSDPNGFLSSATTDCSACIFAERCPVNANLVALKRQRPQVRQRLNTLLRDIALDDRIHLGPRSLWHLVYQMTVGGLDGGQGPHPSCADMGDVDDSTRGQTLFFSAMFDVERETSDAGGAALFAELDRVDPAKRFTLDAHEHALVASLSEDEDLRRSQPLEEALGLASKALAGPKGDSDRRAVAAVRRAFFIQDDEPDVCRHGWLKEWAGHLATYRQEVIAKTKTRHESVSLLVAVLKDIGGVEGHPAQWHLHLPWRTSTELYTTLTPKAGKKETARDRRVLGPDASRKDGLRPETQALIEKLGVYPLSIRIPLESDPDVRAHVTWPLFRLLRRVDEQNYVVGSLDPERVQNLERIGASLGARAALTAGVAVKSGDRNRMVHIRPDGDGGYDANVE